jgi:hypothetical protein
MQTSDLNKRNRALNLYSLAKEKIVFNNAIERRALEIQKYGLKPLEGLHFVSAEYRNVDVLLTVDKDLLIYSKKIKFVLRVENPINWCMEVIEND